MQVIRPNHVLIEVKATRVCGTDIHIYHGEYVANPPVIMGHKVAGVVAEVGDGVTNCRLGDWVTCETYFYVCQQCDFCRAGLPNLCPQCKSIGSGVHGGFTQYARVPAHNIHHLPANVDILYRCHPHIARPRVGKFLLQISHIGPRPEK